MSKNIIIALLAGMLLWAYSENSSLSMQLEEMADSAAYYAYQMDECQSQLKELIEYGNK
jgi:hypothetical protein